MLLEEPLFKGWECTLCLDGGGGCDGGLLWGVRTCGRGLVLYGTGEGISGGGEELG